MNDATLTTYTTPKQYKEWKQEDLENNLPSEAFCVDWPKETIAITIETEEAGDDGEKVKKENEESIKITYQTLHDKLGIPRDQLESVAKALNEDIQKEAGTTDTFIAQVNQHSIFTRKIKMEEDEEEDEKEEDEEVSWAPDNNKNLKKEFIAEIAAFKQYYEQITKHLQKQFSQVGLAEPMIELLTEDIQISEGYTLEEKLSLPENYEEYIKEWESDTNSEDKPLFEPIKDGNPISPTTTGYRYRGSDPQNIRRLALIFLKNLPPAGPVKIKTNRSGHAVIAATMLLKAGYEVKLDDSEKFKTALIANKWIKVNTADSEYKKLKTHTDWLNIKKGQTDYKNKKNHALKVKYLYDAAKVSSEERLSKFIEYLPDSDLKRLAHQLTDEIINKGTDENKIQALKQLPGPELKEEENADVSSRDKILAQVYIKLLGSAHETTAQHTAKGRGAKKTVTRFFLTAGYGLVGTGKKVYTSLGNLITKKDERADIEDISQYVQRKQPAIQTYRTRNDINTVRMLRYLQKNEENWENLSEDMKDLSTRYSKSQYLTGMIKLTEQQSQVVGVKLVHS